MTNEEMRIAIAESQGRHLCHRCNCGFWFPKEDPDCEGSTANALKALPNYPGDLNAMHEAEKVLIAQSADTFRLYIDFLCGVVLKPGEWGIHATAAQRAEAFLRTLNLWKE